MAVRAAAIAVVLAATGAGLVGCTPDRPVTAVPAPSPGGSSAPGGSPMPAIPCPIDDPVAWGDVVAREVVVDAAGEYCATTPSPVAAAMRLDPERTNTGALAQWGFSESDALAAQRSVVTFVVEEVLDSPVLDTDANGTPAQWLAGSRYRFAEFTPADSVVFNGRLPALARDGGARSAATTVEVVRVTAQGGKAGPVAILVHVTATAQFRPADGSAHILLTTKYTVGTDAAGAIVSLGYRYDVGAEAG